MKTQKGTCFLCDAMGQTEEHHIFFGTANRKKSEKYGLKVNLCLNCHRTGPHAVHGAGATENKMLKRKAQEAFEKMHTREEFMKEFGKNYLW